jgi:hypothetical protein
MSTPLRRATAAVLTAGLLLACAGDPEDADLIQDPDADEDAELEDDDEGAPLGDDPETDSAPDSSSRGGEFLDVEADLAQQHPGGTVIELRAVRFEGGGIVVDGEIRNEGDHDVVFSINEEPARLRLLDDVGGEYDYVHPDEDADEATIELAAGATHPGPLTFIGPVDEEARSLRLVANVEDPDGVDPDEQDPDDDRPVFVLDAIELETID